MNTSSPLRFSIRSLTLAIAAAGLCALAPAIASAQTKSVTGDFKDSDGNKGTYVDTIVTNGATRTLTTVLTRTSDSATSTDVTATTTNTDATRSVTYSHTDFGATAAFTSQKTVTKEKHGQLVGSGSYTTATGDTGTLSTLESKAGEVNVMNGVHNSPTTGITQTLRLEEDTLGFTVVKRIELSPTGTVTTLVTTRYITGVDTTADE